jgi:uncharacterized protein YcnI
MSARHSITALFQVVQRRRFAAALFAALSSSPAVALAHVSLAGPGFAGQSQVLTFSIGHGCEGADTISLEIELPKELSSVRAMPSVFGPVQVKADDTGIATSVKWSKDDAREVDDAFYQVALRAKLPDAPFTTLLFPATQVCRAADGTETTVEWAATPEQVAAAKEGEEPEPAPSLVILPVRARGWNKFEARTAIDDLTIFDDAEIVWVDDAAYSANPTTKELIADEDGVEVLTKIKAGAEIWVKY